MKVIVINHSNMSNNNENNSHKDNVKRVSVNTIDLPTLSVPQPQSLQLYQMSSSNKATRSHSFHASNEPKLERTSKRSSVKKQLSNQDADETDHVVIRKPVLRPVTLKSSFLRKKIKEYEGMSWL